MPTATASRLGEKLLQCRRRSHAGFYFERIGYRGLPMLILLPVVVAALVGFGSLMALDHYVGLDRSSMTGKLLFFGWPTFILVGMYFWEFCPPAPNLVLFENGFTYKGKTFSFEDLERVDIDQETDSATLQVDGATISMKDILVQNKFDDVQDFFGYIQTTFPEIPVRV